MYVYIYINKDTNINIIKIDLLLNLCQKMVNIN